jgi:hypothetical protein
MRVIDIRVVKPSNEAAGLQESDEVSAGRLIEWRRRGGK